jgi:carboxypeptidase Q
MRRIALTIAAAATLCLAASPLRAQTWTVEDPVLKSIWQQGMEQSQAMKIAQVLTDSLGPRLTGTPNFKNAVDWAAATLKSWGIDAKPEQYGTWNGWRRGITHIDLIQPRVRTLEGTMLAWSPGTGGRPVEAPVVAIGTFASRAEYNAWLPTARGKFVAVSRPQESCRPIAHFQEFGQPGAADRITASRGAAATQQFGANKAGRDTLYWDLERAGAVGFLQLNWSNDLGVNKVFSTNAKVPALDLSCEDYGLVYRLAQNKQGPVVRLTAESQDLGEVPAYNVVGMIRGTQLPNEYVMLSAHFDSWDSSSGATDNGTGSTTMLEAMRILAQVYPKPKRTIMIGLWGGEENGLIGSRRFTTMHPEVLAGMQALYNQDNGTGRIVRIGFNGFNGVQTTFRDWLNRIPKEISSQVSIGEPGTPGTGGSDHASFACHKAPAFGLGATSWNYSNVTWHTNRDTFDKIVPEEIRHNATLTAMLVYLASEHPEKLSRSTVEMAQGWPACRDGPAQSPRAGGR